MSDKKLLDAEHVARAIFLPVFAPVIVRHKGVLLDRKMSLLHSCIILAPQEGAPGASIALSRDPEGTSASPGLSE